VCARRLAQCGVVCRHGQRRAPRGRGKIPQRFFFGTHTLSEAEATRLDTDPYMLNVSNNRTANPYDFSCGGFNTITGGRYFHAW
jgi:hypothetical protein